MRFSLEVLLVILLFGNAVSEDWCKTNCSWPGAEGEHLRCAFKELSKNALCPKISPKMSSRDRKRILHYHNVLRNNVSKGSSRWSVGSVTVRGWDTFKYGAGNMLQMVWDTKLEENARIYGSQCNVKAHKPYHCAQTETIYDVHMNKYDQSEDYLTMDNAINKFASSKRFIKMYYTDRVLVRGPYISGPWDSFFALVYSGMRHLGCSRVICDCNQIKPLYTTGSVICIYGESPIFTIGGFSVLRGARPCKYCPENTTCRSDSAYRYLCAARGDPLGPEDIPGPDCSARAKLSLLNFLLMVYLVNSALAP